MGWYANSDFSGSAFDFSKPLTGDIDLYALFGRVSDVIQMNQGRGEFFNTYYLGPDNVSEPLVSYNGQSAIQVRPSYLASASADERWQYRMQFDFDPFFDISEFGEIELDLASDGDDPPGVVISIFSYKEDADGNRTPESDLKIMFFPGSFTGSRTVTIGEKLFYKSRDITGIEIYSAAPFQPASTTNPGANPNLYITRIAATGVSLKEPDITVPVPATNIALTLTPPKINGQRQVQILASKVPVDLEDPDPTFFKKVYAHFDPPGAGVSAIEFKFSRRFDGTATKGGSNFKVLTVIDGSGAEFSEGEDYVGWFGWGTPNPAWTGNPALFDTTDALDISTLRCVTFEVQCIYNINNGPMQIVTDDYLTLDSVTFIKGQALPDDAYIVFSKGAFKNNANFNRTGTNATSTAMADIKDGRIEVNGTGNGGNALVQFGVAFPSAVSLVGYTKLRMAWQTSDYTGLPQGTIAATGGGFTNINVPAPPGGTVPAGGASGITDFNITGTAGMTMFRYASTTGNTHSGKKLYITNIWFEK
jgi:hypothetical protein